MGLFRSNMKRRHLVCGEIHTTIALEPAFWIAVDRQAEAAGIRWQRWAGDRLAEKPEGPGRASWLRLELLRIVEVGSA